MEAVFQSLPADQQAHCLSLNPSPEDLALAETDKVARDKLKDERRKKEKMVVKVVDEEFGEADESDPFAEGGEMEDREAKGADEIEKEESEVGVPIAKVRSHFSLSSRDEALTDLFPFCFAAGRSVRGVGLRDEALPRLLDPPRTQHPRSPRTVVLCRGSPLRRRAE